jgi:lipid II:glycine glycyltransferase (peptidoglycan interpeptide bridge formation enzyme)
MRKTTRHAIGKAIKAGVTCKILTDPAEALERFWPLYEETRGRHGFVLWPKASVQAQLEIFGASNNIFAVIARHQGRDVAAALLPHFGNTVFYYHGASAKLLSSVPAAQLLQWEAIKESQRRGAQHYNFWGIAPTDQPNHPFVGITTFKTGFGGYEKDFLHAQDLPFSFGYWGLWAVDTYRKLKRGF